MLQDNTLIFAEASADATGLALEIDGTSLAKKAFVFCTLPSGLTACAVTLKLGNAVSGTPSAISTALHTEVHNATAIDLARGWMAFPMPVADYKYAQADVDITGTAAKDFVCGITDNPSNLQDHVSAGY